MSAFIIPRHKRFAVRHQVQLRNRHGCACGALLIELSQQACRVSASQHDQLEPEMPVTIEIAGFGDIHGRVFSVNDRVLVIRFARPINSAALHELVWTPADGPEPILQLPAFGFKTASAR
jgi:hypothetical protein